MDGLSPRPADAARRRVLVLGEFGWINGGENSWLAIAPLLQRRGWEFVVGCPAEGEFAEAVRQSGIETVDFSVRTGGQRNSQESIRGELLDLLRSVKPSIVHCNSLAMSRIAGPVKAPFGMPAIGVLRDILKLSQQAIADLNQLDAIVAVSRAVRQFHVAQGLQASGTRVIHNGVDLERFQPDEKTGELHGELAIPTGHRLLICIGQIGMRKGTDVVINAFLNLAQKLSDIELLIVGMRNSGKQEAVEYERSCHGICENSENGSRVHWLGRRTDVDRMLPQCSLLLHGARQEPLGRVLLEAAACGCPMIATDVGGTREIIPEDLHSQLIVPSDSDGAMANAAERILSDSNLASRLGHRLRECAFARFDARRCCADVDELYWAVLRSRAGVREWPTTGSSITDTRQM